MMVLLASDKLNLGSLDGSGVLYPTICGVESEERKKKSYSLLKLSWFTCKEI